MSELVQIGTLSGLVAAGCLPAVPAGLRTPLFIAQSCVPGVGKPISVIASSWSQGQIGRPAAYTVVVAYMCVTIVLAVLVGALHERLRVDSKPSSGAATAKKPEPAGSETTRTYTVLMTACAITAGIFLAATSPNNDPVTKRADWMQRVGSMFSDIAVLIPMGFIGVAIGRYLANSAEDEDADAKRKMRATTAIKHQAATAVMTTSSMLLTMVVATAVK